MENLMRKMIEPWKIKARQGEIHSNEMRRKHWMLMVDPFDKDYAKKLLLNEYEEDDEKLKTGNWSIVTKILKEHALDLENPQMLKSIRSAVFMVLNDTENLHVNLGLLYPNQITHFICLLSESVLNQNEILAIVGHVLRKSTSSGLSPTLFTSEFGYESFLQIFDALAVEYCPSMVMMFRPKDYAKRLGWFEKFFLHSLPKNCVLRVLDCFMEEGSKVLLRIGLAILLLVEQEIQVLGIGTELEKYCDAIVQICMKKLVSTKAVNEFFDIAFNLKIRRQDISRTLQAIQFSWALCLKELLPRSLFLSPAWIGFDLDHTLIEYHPNYMNKWFVQAMKKYIDHEFQSEYRRLTNNESSNLSASYNSAIAFKTFGDKLDISNPELISMFDVHLLLPGSKGTVTDLQFGNFLHLNYEKKIQSVFHGINPQRLSRQDIIDAGYENAGPIPLSDFPDRFRVSRTRLSGIFVPFYALLVNIIDSLPACMKDQTLRRKTYQTTAKYLMKALELIQSPFVEDNMQDFLSDPKSCELAIPKQPVVRKWLESLVKNGNHRLFIITNAQESHVQRLMRHAYGKDWENLFEFVITAADKSGAFFKEAKFPPLPPLPWTNTKYIKGGAQAKTVTDLLQNTDSSRDIIFFGDHIQQDVAKPRAFNWKTVAVVEEIEYLLDHKHLLQLGSSSSSSSFSIWNSVKNLSSSNSNFEELNSSYSFASASSSFVDQLGTLFFNHRHGTLYCENGEPTLYMSECWTNSTFSISSLRFLAQTTMVENPKNEKDWLHEYLISNFEFKTAIPDHPMKNISST